MEWQVGRRRFVWGQTPQVRLMGVINATPDSFSDGGRFLHAQVGITHGLEMVSAGADIIDIGGESSRPGADSVSVAEELSRILPIIRGIRTQSLVLISVDTCKPAVAEAALEAGADIINDITALSDPKMRTVAADTGAGVVLMHMRGTPQTMQTGDLSNSDIVRTVTQNLKNSVDQAIAAGVAPAAICLDPGIGFGKTVDQNLALIAGIPRLAALGYPVLMGLSRKSFLGALTDRAVDQRLCGTAAACASAVWLGAHLLRVHDVAEMADVITITHAIQGAHSCS